MKKILILSFLVSINIFADVGIYIGEDKIKHETHEIPKIIKKFNQDFPKKNILFYVHGRSKTLEKEWNNIHNVEKNYNVKVLMLHWDSWSNQISRPVNNAKVASYPLFLSLGIINNLKQHNPSLFENKKTFLLCHSMGNIIFKTYIEKYFSYHKLNSDLFDSIIFNGADVPFNQHNKWLSKVNFGKKIYVTMNENDSVLLASRTLDLERLGILDDRLGLGFGLDNWLTFNREKAQNVTYFDLTKVSGSEHRHYLSSRSEVIQLFKYFFEEDSFISAKTEIKENLVSILD